jgi:hypothetical protein
MGGGELPRGLLSETVSAGSLAGEEDGCNEPKDGCSATG